MGKFVHTDVEPSFQIGTIATLTGLNLPDQIIIIHVFSLLCHDFFHEGEDILFRLTLVFLGHPFFQNQQKLLQFQSVDCYVFHSTIHSSLQTGFQRRLHLYITTLGADWTNDTICRIGNKKADAPFPSLGKRPYPLLFSIFSFLQALPAAFGTILMEMAHR